MPARRPDIAALGLRAVLAGFMANLMSAAIASFFVDCLGIVPVAQMPELIGAGTGYVQ